MTHAEIRNDIVLWVDELGHLYHMEYYCTDYLYDNEGALLWQEKSDGAVKKYSYNSEGLVSQVTELGWVEEDNKEWKFSYIEDKIEQIYEPNGTIINILTNDHIRIDRPQKNASQPFKKLMEAGSLPEMDNDTVSILEELARIPLRNDIDTLGKIKETAQELYADAVRVLQILNIYGIAQLYMPEESSCPSNDEDLSSLAYEKRNYITFIEENYLIEWHGEIFHVSTYDEEFWFEKSKFGTKLRQAKKDGILIWFIDNSIVTHAKINSGMDAFFDENERIERLYYAYSQDNTSSNSIYAEGFYRNDFFDERGRLYLRLFPDGSSKRYKYDEWGLLVNVAYSNVKKPVISGWDFTYYQDDTLAKITDLNGKVITIPHLTDTGQEPPKYTGKMQKPVVIGKEKAPQYHSKLDRLNPVISEVKKLSQELVPEAERILPLLKRDRIIEN